MKKQLIMAMALSIASSQALAGEEKYDHFPSLAAPDVATAYCNLQSYNKKLSKIVDQAELSAEDMVKVHELTYTLENAVIRLQQTLDQAAVDLEEVHKASEKLDNKVIKQSGSEYLSALNKLLAHASCASVKG